MYAPVEDGHILLRRGGKTLTGRNPSPENPPNFDKVVSEYVDKMKHVGKLTMRAVALGLELEETFFERYYENSFWVMRLIG